MASIVHASPADGKRREKESKRDDYRQQIADGRCNNRNDHTEEKPPPVRRPRCTTLKVGKVLKTGTDRGLERHHDFGSSLAGRGSLGKPSTRSPTILRWI